MFTRIMCVGPGRLLETMVTLSFDKNIIGPVDRTYVFTPLLEREILDAFDQFGIDSSSFEIVHEDHYEGIYNYDDWKVDTWYKQQAIKLMAMDSIDADHFLIQDSDIVILRPYQLLIDGELNFKAEVIWNDYQKVYGNMIEAITGLSRKIDISLVNEIMPYHKSDWNGVKRLIEDKSGMGFLNAISDVRPFPKDRWFSEYELLGIYKTHQTGWRYFTWDGQPRIDTWEEFYATNWKRLHAVKFHAPPLKFMSAEEAREVIDYLERLNES